MKRILFTLTLSVLIKLPLAFGEIQVIQVRRNIPLSDDEPVYKDYYLSGGSKSGLRLNLVVPVLRWVNLRENNQAQDQSMKILEPVGLLKIIYVQEQLAVARLYEAADYSDGPVLDQPGIMMGDVVSLEQSFLAKPAKKLPKDSSQIRETQTREPQSEVVLKSSPTVVVAPSSVLLAPARVPDATPPSESGPSSPLPVTVPVVVPNSVPEVAPAPESSMAPTTAPIFSEPRQI
jgi:hypothetical protein